MKHTHKQHVLRILGRCWWGICRAFIGDADGWKCFDDAWWTSERWGNTCKIRRVSFSYLGNTWQIVDNIWVTSVGYSYQTEELYEFERRVRWLLANEETHTRDVDMLEHIVSGMTNPLLLREPTCDLRPEM